MSRGVGAIDARSEHHDRVRIADEGGTVRGRLDPVRGPCDQCSAALSEVAAEFVGDMRAV